MQIIVAIDTWPRHTRPVIDAELTKLSNLIDLVPGEENREGVNAQIDAIVSRMTTADASEEFGEDFIDLSVLSAALNAVEWLWDGGEAPSVDWYRMIGKDAGTYSIN